MERVAQRVPKPQQYHYARWRQKGTWGEVNEALRQEERQRLGHNPEPGAAIVDSQNVKTTEIGGERGYDAGKKVRGRQRPIVVDTLGHLLEVVVHKASIQERDGVKLVFARLFQATKDSLRNLWADGGDAGALICTPPCGREAKPGGVASGRLLSRPQATWSRLSGRQKGLF